jgi:hypothetical protein
MNVKNDTVACESSADVRVGAHARNLESGYPGSSTNVCCPQQPVGKYHWRHLAAARKRPIGSTAPRQSLTMLAKEASKGRWILMTRINSGAVRCPIAKRRRRRAGRPAPLGTGHCRTEDDSYCHRKQNARLATMRGCSGGSSYAVWNLSSCACQLL